MKNSYILLYSLNFTTICSCIFIHIKTPGSVATTYMYYVKADKLKVKFNNEDICKLSYNDTIYALKGVELKACLAKTIKAMIYL